MYMRPGAGQDFLESRPLLQQFIKTCPPFILLQSSLPNMHTADSEYFVTTHYNLTGAKSFIHSFPGYCLNVPTWPVKGFYSLFSTFKALCDKLDVIFCAGYFQFKISKKLEKICIFQQNCVLLYCWELLKCSFSSYFLRKLASPAFFWRR